MCNSSFENNSADIIECELNPRSLSPTKIAIFIFIMRDSYKLLKITTELGHELNDSRA